MAEVHILRTQVEAVRAAAEFVAALAEERTARRGRFTVALSGGSTPRDLYRLLGSQPYAERLAWERWHVFWGDERCLPPEHEESNYRMAREALLDRVPVPPEHIHRIRGEWTPEAAAREYERELRRAFRPTTPILDLVLLGLGDDGHTASLFPETDALEEVRQLVVANWVPRLQAHRVTFTLPLINRARHVAFLVTGGSKATMVGRVLLPHPGGQLLPAALVRPRPGGLHWFLDTEAASCLTGVAA